MNFEKHNEYYNYLNHVLNYYPPGTKIYVEGEKRPYTVKAAAGQFVIATKPAFGTVLYTILDLKNGIRGTDTRVFCTGYETHEMCEKNLTDLLNNNLTISRRNCVKIKGGEADVTRIVLIDGNDQVLPDEWENYFDDKETIKG